MLLSLGAVVTFGVSLGLAQAGLAAGTAPRPGLSSAAGTPDPVALEIAVDAAAPGPIMSVELIGNASRLDTLLALRSASDLRGGRPASAAQAWRARFPHFKRFRIGNTFVGYRCAGLDFDEIVVRGPDGRIEYRFEQTLAMLQRLVDAGIRPHLALTGTPLALVPADEEPIRHRVYGCVNAPRIVWTGAEPRDRVPEWWALQDAFFDALVERFGRAEVAQWTFATWTEPFNRSRKPAHLVLPADLVLEGRHDAAVAAIVAASIDVAMKHRLPIRIGNLGGRVEQDYPALIGEIAKFARGREYLAYVDGYAISRYRTQPGRSIARAIDAGFALLGDPAMPDKPLYIDELGDLSGIDGAIPFEAASGLAGGLFLSTALERVFGRQDDSIRSPKGVAVWHDGIGARARDTLAAPQAYLASPASHVLGMFAAFNGAARLPARGPAHAALAGVRGGVVMVLLLAAGDERDLSSPVVQRQRRIVLLGLEPNAAYEIAISELGRTQGNPISKFLGGAPGYLQDSRGRFARVDGRWVLSSRRWEACFFDEDAACAWRAAAREIEHPSLRTLRTRTDGNGMLSLSLDIDSTAIALVQARRAD